MTEKEVQEIYSRLLELTKASAIQWKKTGESEYTANFSRSSVALNKEEITFMTLYNEDGLEIAYVAPSKADVPELCRYHSGCSLLSLNVCKLSLRPDQTTRKGQG